jgi:hypothetical protein
MRNEDAIKFQNDLERRFNTGGNPLFAIAIGLMEIAHEIDRHATQMDDISAEVLRTVNTWINIKRIDR